MKASLTCFAAKSISLWIGLSSKLPALEFLFAINLALWFHSTVFLDAIPGNTDFLPPENPAKKWGSIKPSLINKSASSTNLFTHNSPPDGRIPLNVISESSYALWITISSSFTIFSPYLLTNSSWVVGLCIPVAIRIVIFTSLLYLRISSNKIGIVIWLGTGLVWSLEIITICFLDFASSQSGNELIGLLSASLTNSCSDIVGT